MHLIFAALAILTAAFSLTSALIYQAEPVAYYVTALRVSIALGIILHGLLPWFIAEYSSSRPLPVLVGISGLFLVLFVVNLTQPCTILYEEITGFETLTLPWGERIVVPKNTPSAWSIVALVTVVVIVPAFSYYTLIARFRRDRRRSAFVMMGAIALFVAANAEGILSRLGIIDFIPVGAFGVLGMIVTMGIALDHELRAERKYLQTILDYVPAHIVLKDLEGRYLMVNRHFEETFGASVGGGLYKTADDLFPTQQAEALQLDDREAFATRSPIERESVAMIQGEPRTFLLIKVPLFHGNGAPFATCGIATDITERKRAEQSIMRLATAVEQSSETIVITDTDGNMLYVNPAFEQTSGYARAESIGQNSRLLKSGAHDRAYYRELWDVIKRGEVWRGRLTNRRKNGTLFEEAVTISPLRDLAGRIVEYVAVKRDVSREVQLEAQVRQAQKMEAVGHLAGGVAHDFNNMLAALMMGLELLGRNRSLDKDTRDLLGTLATETKRAASLTQQLLMFSRRSVLDVRILDLNDVVANLLKMLGRLVGEHITLAFERRSALPAIEADAGMLEQVLMNLVVNARDAMAHGGRISLITEVVELDPEKAAANPNRRTGRFVCMAVADTGCGMDATTLGRIFEPFFTTKDPGHGTGLGLATVYGIVAQHGGWVEVESTVNVGTAFRVYLPASAKTVQQSEPQAAQAVPRGKETLLVVEDDPGVRQILVQTLRVQGYRVLAASDGHEAMKLWQEHRLQIDLLLTDMVMPEGMTGLELAERIKAENPVVKIIISSGYSTELVRPGNTTAGGVVYLPKPYGMAQLAEVLRQCLTSPAPLT